VDNIEKVTSAIEGYFSLNHQYFGPSSLNFFVYAFTKTTVWVDFHQIKEEILLKILHIIHADGAFPTQGLQIEQIPPEPSL
jgi:MscS family membrane protein